MNSSQIAAAEHAIGVEFPAPYRVALESHGLPGEWTEHPEFFTNPDILISENKHFKRDPQDLSDVRTPGALGALKFWLTYGSGKRLIEFRRRLHKTWVQGKRLIIGNDLGEEQYFIILDDPEVRVHRHELESRQSRVVAPSVQAWLKEVHALRAAESDA